MSDRETDTCLIWSILIIAFALLGDTALAQQPDAARLDRYNAELAMVQAEVAAHPALRSCVHQALATGSFEEASNPVEVLNRCLAGLGHGE